MKIFYTTVTVLFCTLLAFPAAAQMSREPWGFAPQNRASIAALMQQTEGPSAAGTTTTALPPTLICGGGGQTGATANSTCIILNNADGTISLDQNSDGSQTADGTAAHAAVPSAGADDVLSALSVGH